MTDLSPQHITVPRTARYYQIGSPNSAVRDVWIVCHGYGQLAASFAVPFRALADPARIIIVPEALSRFYLDVNPPHTPESPIGALWMTREDREAEINDIVSYLDALTERMFESLATHGVQREMVHLHVLGFSQGAPVVSRWVARSGVRVGHLVLWGSGIPQDVNIRSTVERLGTLRLDFVYGTGDRFVTPEALAAQKAVLAAAGVPYQIRTFDGGHTLNGALLRAVFGEG